LRGGGHPAGGAAAANPGVLPQQRGDLEGAESAYRGGDERGDGTARCATD